MSPETVLFSNIFLAIFLFGLVFTVVSVLLGVADVGDVAGHIGHPGHIGHVGHVGHAAHAGSHAGHAGNGSAHAAPRPEITRTDMHIGSHSGDADAGMDGLPVLNMPTIMAFMTWFGGAGYIVTRTIGLGPAFAVPLALLSGLTGGSIMFVLLARVLWPMRSTPLSSAEFSLPGTHARVVSSIRAGGVGEIVYSKAGSRFTAGAREIDNLPVAKGTEVVIAKYEHGLAYVYTAHDPLDE